ncbi:transcriptional activator DEMETER isoform X2 [Humulus lupulus]|uniref:transcriptional activator DEMETER isoform X2 n=1 Tax=Humulus lupulus TaxID=3486 RepID=UPI002B406F9F|nr:transcriptional activator DEMETER isoform X2 [Humulus lupulus]
MNLNFGEGFPYLGAEEFQFESSWVPATPEKPPILGSIAISDIQQGRHQDPVNSLELASITGRHASNFDCLAQIFNANSQVSQNMGYFRHSDGHPTENNLRTNGRDGSHQQSLPEDFVGLNNNLSFMQLLQHGGAEVPSSNTSLLRLVEMAAERPVLPQPPHQMINIQQDYGSGGFNIGAGFISSIAEGTEIGNSHWQVGKSWTDSNTANLLIREQSECSSSNPLNYGGSLPQTLSYDLSTPCKPGYDLNYSPRNSNALTNVVNSPHFTPVTPNHVTSENQRSALLKSAIDETPSQERDTTKNLIECREDEAIQLHGDELLQKIVDSSSTAISTPYKENKDYITDLGIDLNETPQQKPPKRRKHRPKVIVEGKPKRGRKPSVPKNTEPKQPKRKYVRKNVPKESTSQTVDMLEETRNPNTALPKKSSKKVLNFDLEKIGDANLGNIVTQQEMHNMNGKAPSVTLDYQATELCNGINHARDTTPSMQSGIPVEQMVENHFMNQMPNGNVRPFDSQATVALFDSTKDMHVKNFNEAGRHEINRNVDQQLKRKEDEYILKQQQTCAEAIVRDRVQRSDNCENLQKITEPTKHAMPQPIPKTPSSNEARGSKRDHCHTTEHAHLSTTNHMDASTLLYRGIYEICSGISQTPKKKKIGDDCRDTPSNVKAAEGLGNVETTRAHNVNASGLKSKENCTLLDTQFSRTAERETNEISMVNINSYDHSTPSEHNIPYLQILSRQHSQTGQTGSARAQYHANSLSTGATVEESKHLSSLPKTSTTLGNAQVFQTCYASMSEIKQTKKGPLIQSALSVLSTVQKPLPKKRGPKKKQVHPTAIDEVNVKAPLINSALSVLSTMQEPLPKKRGPKKKQVQLTEIDEITLKAPLINSTLSVLSTIQEPLPKKRGPKKKQVQLTAIDEVIYKFQSLNLNGSSSGLQNPDQNALVLYQGNGAVVPYGGFEFIKKRKPRPKVDLDPETNRIWNLLMGKEGSEDLEGTDTKKEKWWEEERKVFSGRVDSFIARMHLVQGDRRFSRWKGSVVDSVIGVFLTQNVSDHLSSSAFMSLAARFPLKSTGYNTQDKVNTVIISKEATIPIPNLNDTIKWHEDSREQINGQNRAPNQSAEGQWRDNIAITKKNLTDAQSQSSEEEIILSQNSFDSSITQVAGGIRSCSGSNSEAEDPCTGWKPSNTQVSSLTDYLLAEKSATVQEVYDRVNGCTVFEKYKSSYSMKHPDFPYTNNADYLYMQPAPHSGNDELFMTTDPRAPEVCCFESFSEESTSSWHSTGSRSVKGPDTVSKTPRCKEQAERLGDNSEQQNQVWKSQKAPSADPCALLCSQLTAQEALQSNIEYSRSSCNNYQHLKNDMFQAESTSLTNPVKFSDTTEGTVPHVNKLTGKAFEAGDSISAVSIQIEKENKLAEPSSDHTQNGARTKTSKAKRGNATGQNKNEVDWDILRQQAETSGDKKEKRKDALDSIDYEAIRTANVKDISDAIKERGMNNMLAERIKEFLNRIVKDHGSIDLEWLRDVPPDEAKDYLLSIRGLGLKSVECVRLLTLHHLAFPVDTNVGRIAVRLGWVPLQPLPESLQLHLLELYPVLETIQKYLWPRLCKLDQRTLYELHYQMITFGKVFCTKSKPNCNACPMRGECRHFASAFASARLALPGPEEKRIVTSDVPTQANSPAVVMNPALLPPPENNSLIEVGSKTEKCEPIIEEPATPEQECIEVSQSDIEDSFYEDPDEIPTIKLNIEEFTETLQNYLQKNMELQEGDMSKALVALNPEAASIPIPKLKNVSRLRTEHQVYELPDSHPLLERLDKREPDDPSPYLLAIWTPGETANCIQPSERSCSSQQPDKLCDEKTCFSCNSIRETNSQTVRGTILIPCRTAMRGSFPLNGTYFQVNEVFADHDSSLNPISVPREWIWNLPRRMVYFGTSVSTIFKGLSTEGIQFCFWKGFVCVRGFDLTTRAPRPLIARLHFPASKLIKTKNDDKR